MHKYTFSPGHSNPKGRKQGSGPSSCLQENTFMCRLLLIPVWKSTLGSWKERPFGNIGNSTGRCHYLSSGGCLWCLKGTTPPSKTRLWPKTTEGLLAARETQRFSPTPNHELSSLSVGHEMGPGPHSPSTHMTECLLSDMERQSYIKRSARGRPLTSGFLPMTFLLQRIWDIQ